jgi:hypothetical protein
MIRKRSDEVLLIMCLDEEVTEELLVTAGKGNDVILKVLVDM